MSAASIAELVVLIVLLAISTPLLGGYMAKVFGASRLDRVDAAKQERTTEATATGIGSHEVEAEVGGGGTATLVRSKAPPLIDEGPAMAKVPGDRFFRPIERLIYKVTGVNEFGEQRWTTYAVSVLAFSLVSAIVLYGMQRLQAHLPFNPDHLKSVPPALSFNTAVSFVTNTNWQNYAGESTMAQFTQMAGLVVQMFVSAATGLAVAVALIRGLTRNKSNTLGNFWVDLVRATVRILLPITFIFALLFVTQGMIQNFHATHVVTTVTGAHQSIVGGPQASLEPIKNLGTNGGGYDNANGANPFENPNGITNLLEIWLLLSIPFALTWTFGKMARDRRQGYAVLGAMFSLWIIGSLLVMGFEANGNIHVSQAHVSQHITAQSPGGNMEGKEIRNGPAISGLFNSSATGTSTGAINSAGDSYTPLGGGVLLVNMMLGEVSPGGVGSGLYGMLILALLSVFIAGLMVGRTPEYLGKKIQAAEMKLVVLYLLMVPVVALVFAGISVVMTSSQSSIFNPGSHGLSEVTYAFVSASNNNGSAFAGLSGNTDWYNTTLAICMLVGRFALMVPVLAIAGSLGRKQRVPASSGTLPTGTTLFGILLAGIAVIVVGLTYFPVLALGPIAEHLTGSF
jgi:potassium-transporting ATPase potassium-binding subunit